MRNFNDGAKRKFHYWFVIAMLSLFGPYTVLLYAPIPSHPIPISIISGGGTRKAISRCLPNVDVSHRISGHSSNIVGGRARARVAKRLRVSAHSSKLTVDQASVFVTYLFSSMSTNAEERRCPL